MTYKIETKDDLERFITANWDEVNTYLNQQEEGLPTPFYTSVDIRESFDKFAPVDNNLYPAGFNNICMLDLNITVDRLKMEVFKYVPQAKKIAILAESHTKNLFYLDHLYQLQQCFTRASFDCQIISFDEKLFEEDKASLKLQSHSGFEVLIHQANIKNGTITLNGEELDFVVLNNDQSKPINIEWNTVKTPVAPTPNLGWFHRQKTTHFTYYKKIADQFCEHFSINPNLIQAGFRVVNGVDFLARKGLETLSEKVSELQSEVGKNKTIYIKASQGTYGMGIMTVTGPDEVLSMNRKMRNKMDIGKNKIKFTSLILQEGIETVITHDKNPAEITIYLVGGKSVGGFMRSNPLKDTQGNLNSKGMLYQKFCISEIHQGHDHKAKEAVYSTIARISTIASSYEIKETLE